jgi:hypothetical protein
MIISISGNEKDKLTFFPKSIIDGMKVGIMKEKLRQKGIPVEMEMSANDAKVLKLTISQSDLLDLLC